MTNNYKTIFKGTMLFGGVQIFQILVSFLRNKLNAIYLGPEGLGMVGLFSSSLAMIITISSMGFSSSAVRYIASEPDELTKLKIIKIGKLLLYFQSVVGLLLTIGLSFFLSIYTFGNKDYILSYIILSLYSFFSVLSAGNMAIIQGKQETKRIAKANIFSSFIGLLFGIPFLMFLKIKAIIPVLMITPCISALYTNRMVRKNYTSREVTIQRNEYINTIKLFLTYGVVITLAQLFGAIADYFINVFVTRIGSVSDIGYYNSGMSITYQCIGLVFNAMSMDYSPKLTAVCNNDEKTNDLINQQGIVTMLLSVPILSVMMIMSPILIRIFLSSEFLPINSFIQIVILGMVFKAITFCLGTVSFAKGDKKVFFFYEGIYGTIQRFILAVIGYKLFGLNGLAWGFVINFMLYLTTVFLLCKMRYRFQPTKEFVIITILSVIVVSCLFILTRFNSIVFIISEIFIILLVCIICLIILEKKIGIIDFIKNKINRKGNL